MRPQQARDPDDLKALRQARRRWGETILLRRNHTGVWRPVWPMPRHRLSPERFQRQMAAFIAWRSGISATHKAPTTPERISHEGASTTKDDNHGQPQQPYTIA